MKDGLSRLIYEKAVIPYLNQKCRQVVAMDKRDRLGLEHDSKGRFTKKDGSNLNKLTNKAVYLCFEIC